MENKCIDVIEENWQMRAEDLREFYELETSGIDEARNEEGVLFNEYGLSWDFVIPGTFEDEEFGYWRYQMSWGGPADEIRFYTLVDEDCFEFGYESDMYEITKVQYVYQNWFDGAVLDLDVCERREDWELACFVFDYHEGTEIQPITTHTARKGDRSASEARYEV